MLCVRCKKRPAIVFVQKLEAGEAKSEGYCLSCARELGIKPVDDIMKQFGISDQDLEAVLIPRFWISIITRLPNKE